MRTLLPAIRRPTMPPAENSATEAISAARSGRSPAAAAPSGHSAHSTASAMGGITSPPPKRIRSVCAPWNSTDARS